MKRGATLLIGTLVAAEVSYTDWGEVSGAGTIFKQERNNAKFDDEEYFRGFGARYQLSRNWGVRAEWERANRLKAELLPIGAGYRF